MQTLNKQAGAYYCRHWPAIVLCAVLTLSLSTASSIASADAEKNVAADTVSTNKENGLNLAAHAGKAVYIDFWASWCGPCRASFPMMNEMREQYTDESLAIIAVNVDSDHAAAQRFLKKYPATFDIVYDPEGKLATEYEVRGMPSSYLLNSEGELVYTHVGFRKKDGKKIKQQLEMLLGTE